MSSSQQYVTTYINNNTERIQKNNCVVEMTLLYKVEETPKLTAKMTLSNRMQ